MRGCFENDALPSPLFSTVAGRTWHEVNDRIDNYPAKFERVDYLTRRSTGLRLGQDWPSNVYFKE
jgi:Neuraminidase (sialidase)